MDGIIPAIVSAFGIGTLLLAILLMFKRGELPRNNTIGFRTEYTIKSDDNWDRSHQAVAPSMMLQVAICFISGLSATLLKIVDPGHDVIPWIPLIIGLILLFAMLRVQKKIVKGLANEGPAPSSP